VAKALESHPKLTRGGLLLAAVLLACLAFGGGWLARGGSGSAPSPPEETRAFAPVEGPEAATLASRFRPWLAFDSDEKWRPRSIPSLLAEQGPNGKPLHRFCLRTPGKEDECWPLGSLQRFEALAAKYSAQASSTYLDIGTYEGKYREPEPSAACRKSGLLDCDDEPGSAIYYHVTSSNQRFYIDYWWFLRFNHFNLTNCSISDTGVCDEHEGDWEGVTLVTAPEDEDTLDYVVYAAHKGTFRYPASRLERRDGQPVVYVANGSHASYPRACRGTILCFQPNVLVGPIDVPETDIDGRRPWARNEDECPPDRAGSCLLALPDPEPGQSVWTNWAGLWGATCGKRCAAPHPQSPDSPGRQGRFEHPWCSAQNGSLTCDSTGPGCSDWLGPWVSVLACNPKAISHVLSAQEELPTGELTMKVSAPDGTLRKLSATTPGVVQALGTPLGPGAEVVVSDAGADTEILVRAAKGRKLLEARFNQFSTGTGGKALEIEVAGSRRGVPVLRAVLPDGTRMAPVERRRLTVPRKS